MEQEIGKNSSLAAVADGWMFFLSCLTGAVKLGCRLTVLEKL